MVHFRACSSRVAGAQSNHQSSPEELFDRICFEEHVKHCLASIRPEVEARTYAAYVAHVFEQWPVSKVCETFGLSRSQVYNLKWRLTLKLREKLNDLTGGGIETP